MTQRIGTNRISDGTITLSKLATASPNAAFIQANAAFAAANNAITSNSAVAYANSFVINTGYLQFSDGSKQYTANAGSGGSSSSITNGTSNVSVASSGNVTVTVGGTSNVMTVSSAGAAILGTLSASGNVAFNQTIISISANTTAINYASYVILASLVLTLPASPSVGNWINFSNRSGTTTSVIARNGSNIMGLAENMNLNTLTARGTLAYTGATQGWVLINE